MVGFDINSSEMSNISDKVQSKSSQVIVQGPLVSVSKDSMDESQGYTNMDF